AGDATALTGMIRSTEMELAKGKYSTLRADYALSVLALGDLRSGRTPQALRRIALDKQTGGYRVLASLRARGLSIEAACLLDAGRAEAARAALAEARAILRPYFPTGGTAEPLTSDAQGLVLAEILYRQAEVRILDAGFPADPFAPPVR